MIEWLGSWLKEIILVILLAAFVDLLLPNSVMQRYVKVVVSLFILLTILSPLITLLKTDFDFNKAELSIELTQQSRSKDPLAGNEGQVNTLEAIMQEGKKLQSTHEEQSLRFIEARLEETVKAGIEEETLQSVEGVHVETKLDKLGKLHIQSMQVVLKQHSDRIANGPNSTPSEEQVKDRIVQPVEPIEPVSIHIKVGKTSGQTNNRQQESKSQEMEKAKQQVFSHVMQEWNLSSSQLQVVYAEELR